MLADGTEEGEERWANLLELREVTTRYDDLSAEDALDRLLEETALVADQDSYQSDADMLSLITLHAAKGLEFEVVFIAGLEECTLSDGPGRRGGGRLQPRPAADGGGAAARLRRHDPGAAAAVPVPRLAARDAPRPGHALDGRAVAVPARDPRGADERPAPRRPTGGRGRPGLRDGRPQPRVRPRARRGSAGRSARVVAPTARGAGAPAHRPRASRSGRRATSRRGATRSPAGRGRERSVAAAPSRRGTTTRPPLRPGDGDEAIGSLPARAAERPVIDRPVIPGERRYRDGDRVRHARWGDGIVVSSKLTRSDEEVTIAFRDPQIGRKTLLASLAGLEADGMTSTTGARGGRARTDRQPRGVRAARDERMAGPAFDYVAGGAWDEITLAESVEAWRRHRFVPRVLRDAAHDRRVRVVPRPAVRAADRDRADGRAGARASRRGGGDARGRRGGGHPVLPVDVVVAVPGGRRGGRAGRRALVPAVRHRRHGLQPARSSSGRRPRATGRSSLTVDLPVLGRRERDDALGVRAPGRAPHRRRGGGARSPVRRNRGPAGRGADLGHRSPRSRSWSSLPLVLKGILSPDGRATRRRGGRRRDRRVDPRRAAARSRDQHRRRAARDRRGGRRAVRGLGGRRDPSRPRRDHRDRARGDRRARRPAVLLGARRRRRRGRAPGNGDPARRSWSWRFRCSAAPRSPRSTPSCSPSPRTPRAASRRARAGRARAGAAGARRGASGGRSRRQGRGASRSAP